MTPIVSIHALVKRATGGECRGLANAWVSIHALVKRATELEARAAALRAVSIHALVKRATQICADTGFVGLFRSTPS